MLTDDMIFVFGSNQAGRHGAGAARFAEKNKGAVYGKGEGLFGQSYALPTKGYRIERMTVEQIQVHTQRFMKFAYDHPELTFQMTQIGCGLGGHSKWNIAPLLKHAPSNVWFDTNWEPVFRLMKVTKKYWGTF